MNESFWSRVKPAHREQGKIVENSRDWIVTRMKGKSLVYDNTSDADAPADFAAVGEQVRQEREAGNGNS